MFNTALTNVNDTVLMCAHNTLKTCVVSDYTVEDILKLLKIPFFSLILPFAFYFVKGKAHELRI